MTTRRPTAGAGPRVPATLVCFHAHPDDEALLTGGTIARAAAEGHRVVLVVATAGERGLTDGTTEGLGERRLRELAASARALGVARVEVLGYADSGSTPAADPPAGPPVAPAAGPPAGPAAGPPAISPAPVARFADADVEEAARRLAAVLAEERADVLTVYDAHGGYGHPDHVQVHRVGHRAAELAGTPVVLEATLPRTWFVRAVRVLRALGRVLPVPDLPDERPAYTAPELLTHRIDVAAYLGPKRAALRAHASQQGGGARTLRLLLALPGPLARLVLGTEWFREPGPDAAAGRVHDDVFATLPRTVRPRR